MNATRNTLPLATRTTAVKLLNATVADHFGSPDLLTDVLNNLEKQLWLLEAHTKN